MTFLEDPPQPAMVYDYTESEEVKRERRRHEIEAHNKMWDKVIDRLLPTQAAPGPEQEPRVDKAGLEVNRGRGGLKEAVTPNRAGGCV